MEQFARTQRGKENPQAHHVLGFLLLRDGVPDYEGFLTRAQEDWGLFPDSLSPRGDSLCFTLAGMTVTCCYLDYPIPAGRAEEYCLYNTSWLTGTKEIANYRGHLLLSVSDCKSALAGYMLCTTLAASWLSTQDAIAFLFPDQQLILDARYFVQQAEALGDGELPVELWVSFGTYVGEGGNCAYTFGLEEFGKREVEILHSRRSEDDLLDLLYDVASYVIGENQTLRDGDVIGFREDEHLRVTLSHGEAVEGESYKITY